MLISKRDCISITGANFYSISDVDDVERPRGVTLRFRKEDAERFIIFVNDYKTKNRDLLKQISLSYGNELRNFWRYEEDEYIVFPVAIPMAVVVNYSKKSPKRTISFLKDINKEIDKITCDIVFEEDDTDSRFYLVLQEVRGRAVTTAGIPINCPFFKWNKEITLAEVPESVIMALKNRTVSTLDELFEVALKNDIMLSEKDALRLLELLDIDFIEK